MKKILIGVGHLNVKYNSIVALRGNTGTVGELEINKRVADMVIPMLRERGFEATETDANANDDKSITTKDFDLALFLHCDQDTPNDQGGGMCGSGDKSVDMSWEESLRIKKVFDATYFSEVKIVNKNFVTQGMAKYYVWQYLSSKTPCVLLEMGQAKDPHDSVLLGNTELIATGIVKSVCKALNVDYEIVSPTVSDTTDYKLENKKLLVEIDTLKNALIKAKTDFDSSMAVKDSECQQNLLSYKDKIINFIKTN